MKILVINGSPKGGRSNTLRLTEAFIEGIRKGCGGDSAPEVKVLDISKMDIRSCLGCFSCWKRTPGRCCINDDMPTVLEAMLWADVTVWSFPLYYFGLPGKLKTLMDRQLPLTLPFMVSDTEGGGHPARYDMSGKRTVLISTCGFYTARSNYDSVIAQFDRICGAGKYTTLFCGEGELFSVPELSARTGEYLEVVKRAGEEYACGGISEATVEALGELLFPRDAFERMADASWGLTQDGEREDESLTFTRQMAALYNPSSYKGKELLLDMDYTDIGRRYRIILGKDGSRVSEDTVGEATTVIHTPLSVWRSIAAGEIEGSAALMQHQYSVEGDFDLLLRWDDYFGQRSGADATNKKVEKGHDVGRTDMSYLLIPWITLWVGVNISVLWGSVVSIAACMLLPLLFFKNKKTVYDHLSTASVSALALALILGVSDAIVIPISYLLFGLMWSVSAFLKIPLSAEYSMNDYGGEGAFKNPIFIKTNRILSAAWGVLYLFTAVLTCIGSLTPAGAIIRYLDLVFPILMGIFTAWFQKWYPKRVARG